ncbi:MAG TPA: hypothetical protein VNH18_20540, partial [Bryobacteraceae bacterium]|nr:hypothetical protein [Bryobacteraceae bacterium]
MTRRRQIIHNTALVVGGFIAVLAVAVVITVQTDWFRNYVRSAIVSTVEEGTGGRAEIGSFAFDVKSLHATVQNFVVHGNEPAGAKPFVSIARVELYLRLFSSFKRLYEISYLGVDHPEVSVITLPDGRSNVPIPRQKSTSNQSALETVVDLAVGKFAIDRGMIAIASTRQALDMQGRNLQAQLTYSFLTRSYSGRIALEPLYVLNGKNTPVLFKVTLPVRVSSDKIELLNASISTPLSNLAISGSLEDMKRPKVSGTVKGRIAVRDVASAANIAMTSGGPAELNLEGSATVSDEVIRVESLKMQVGQSSVQASGTLRDPKGAGALDIQTSLALNELGRMAKLSLQPGTVQMNGKARLDAADNLEVKDLRLLAFGGEFTGEFTLADFERYRLTGELRHLNIHDALLSIGERLPYDGNLSGPVKAEGDTTAGANGITGTARLTISPGRRGVPVSGLLNAVYDGAKDSIAIDNSWLALPNSRLALSGALNQRVDLVFTSHDLGDLTVLSETPVPVVLNKGGVAQLNATVTGKLSAPRIVGQVAVTKFAVEGRQFDSLQANVAGSASEARVTGGALTRGAMQAQFEGSAGLRNWVTTQRSPVTLNAAVQHGDLADVLALAGRPTEGYAGPLNGSAQVTGTLGNPQGGANVQIGSGRAAGEAFNQVALQVNMRDQAITVPAATIDAAAGRIRLTAEYQHPGDSLTTGQLHAHVQSDQLDLARSQTVQTQRPNTGGMVRVNADVNGAVRSGEPAFILTAVSGDVSARGLLVDGQNYGDVSATARTTGQTVAYNFTSDFAGSTISGTGNTELRPDYPTRAHATLANLPVERLLVLAKRPDIPARGMVAGSLQFAGTMSAPQGSAQLNLTRATVYGETIDRANVRVSYQAQTIEVPQLEVVSGSSHIEINARYDHLVGDLERGTARFTIANTHLDLARLSTVQQYRPGLAGMADLSGSGTAALQGKDRVLLSALDANLGVSGIRAQGKDFGALRLTASTTGGNRLNFVLDSDLAGSAIHGNGNAVLTGDYPVDGRLTFRNITWTRVADLLGRNTAGGPTFEAAADGEAELRGPVMKGEQLTGSLAVTRLSLSTIPRGTAAARSVTIANQGPVQVGLEHGTVRIQNAHLAGPNTELRAGGTIQLFGNGQAMNLTVNGNADLAVFQSLDRDVYSSGKVVLATTLRGETTKPLVNGELTLQDVALSHISSPIGISNANGSLVFNGTSAQLRNVTAESGGGKITLSGFATFAEVTRFGVRAAASNVRVRAQQGVSLTADADIRLTGTTDASRMAGDVTLQRITYAPQSDLGSILTRSAPPVQSPATPSPLLDNMKLELRVRSAPGMLVESSLTESLQASAD